MVRRSFGAGRHMFHMLPIFSPAVCRSIALFCSTLRENFEDPFGPKPPGCRGIYISPLPRRARVCPFRDCARGERFRVQALFLFLGVTTRFDSVIMIGKISLRMGEEPSEPEPKSVG